MKMSSAPPFRPLIPSFAEHLLLTRNQSGYLPANIAPENMSLPRRNSFKGSILINREAVMVCVHQFDTCSE